MANIHRLTKKILSFFTVSFWKETWFSIKLTNMMRKENLIGNPQILNMSLNLDVRKSYKRTKN